MEPTQPDDSEFLKLYAAFIQNDPYVIASHGGHTPEGVTPPESDDE
jgi:hypothetical protein